MYAEGFVAIEHVAVPHKSPVFETEDPLDGNVAPTAVIDCPPTCVTPAVVIRLSREIGSVDVGVPQVIPEHGDAVVTVRSNDVM